MTLVERKCCIFSIFYILSFHADAHAYIMNWNFAASRSTRVVSALSRARLQDGYVSYPWDRRKQEVLLIPNSSCFLSMLLLPKASDAVASRYNDVEDTLARANVWLNAAQASGVPIVFMNVQIESLLTKVKFLNLKLSSMIGFKHSSGLCRAKFIMAHCAQSLCHAKACYKHG